MVELAKRQKGVLGARMTGGGFGGCTVNLVRAEDVLSFQRNLADAYREVMGLTPEIYVCRASDGAGEIGLALLKEAESPSR